MYAHFIVANTYNYTQQFWQGDIVNAQSLGIDAFALNIGPDSWQADQVNDAYEAAASLNSANPSQTAFKLFLSFDLSFNWTAANIVSLLQTCHGHPNQFVYNGGDLLSTISGETVLFGQDNLNDAWQIEIKDVLAEDGIDIYFVPSWMSLSADTVFSQYPVIDGLFSWAAWHVLSLLKLILRPTGDNLMTDSLDIVYMNGATAANKTYIARENCR